MTAAQKLALRASEIRTRLAELGGIAEQTDETRAEIATLRTEYGDVETRWQAAETAADDPKPVETRTEDRELAALIAGASIGAIFGATIEHRADRRPDRRAANASRTRAESDSPRLAPDGVARDRAPGNRRHAGAGQCRGDAGRDHPGCLAGLVPCVPWDRHSNRERGRSCLPRPVALRPTPACRQRTPNRTRRPAPSPRTCFPRRGSRRRSSTPGRTAPASPAWTPPCAMNLGDALSDKLDQQILATAPTGCSAGTVLANHNVTTETTYALYRKQFAYGRVDGKYASMTGDLRVVMGSATLAHAASQYRGNNDNTDALMALGRAGVPVKVSAHVPAVAATQAERRHSPGHAARYGRPDLAGGNPDSRRNHPRRKRARLSSDGGHAARDQALARRPGSTSSRRSAHVGGRGAFDPAIGAGGGGEVRSRPAPPCREPRRSRPSPISRRSMPRSPGTFEGRTGAIRFAMTGCCP